MEKYRKFMASALAEARKAFEAGEVPIGAVIVKDNEVIASGYNEVETRKNPLAHAEMIAINRAAKILGEKNLKNCTLYVTLEPCPMCAGAIVLAKIGEVIFAANEPKFGSCGSLYMIADDDRLNHRAKIIGGIMEKEAAELMREFFKNKRTNNV